MSSALEELLFYSEKSKTLDLKDRTLREIDIALLSRALSGKKYDLIALNLTNVKISAEDAIVLAKALEFNVSVQKLSFEHNPLGFVGVSALAEAVKLNTTLKEFSLADTLLNAQSAAQIASAIYTNGTLVSLHLETNRIGPEGAKYIADALLVNQSIKYLNLEANSIGDTGASHIAAALKQNSTLSHLNIKYNGITSKGAAILGDSLQAQGGLQEISASRLNLPLPLFRGEKLMGAASAPSIQLRDAALSADLDLPIVAPLLKLNRVLTKLVLSNVGLCGIGPDGRGKRILTGVSALADAFQSGMFKDRLVELCLDRNFINDSAAVQLSEGIRHLGALTSINLSRNDVRRAGVEAVAAALKGPIKDVNLSYNENLSSDGAEVIASLLAEMNRKGGISVLNIEKCGIGDAGAFFIAKILSKCASLESLFLEKNEITGKGYLELGKALFYNQSPCLKTFTICSNWSISPTMNVLRPDLPSKCTTEEIILLCGLFIHHPTIRSVAFDGWPLTSEGISYLCSALKLNSSVDTVSLKNCRLDASCGKMLLEVMAAKPGVCIIFDKGNQLGDELFMKLLTQQSANQRILSDNCSADLVRHGVKVHLLGEAGVGKSTFQKAIRRSYWDSFFKESDLEKAPDRGSKKLDERTRGVQVKRWEYCEANFILYDYGGLHCFRSMLSPDLLDSPFSIYIVFVNLALKRAEQRAELKRWLQCIQVCVREPKTSSLIIVGSRADSIGDLGQNYLDKLWEGIMSDLDTGATVEGSLPSLCGCFALDCRKGHSKGMEALRSSLIAARNVFLKTEEVFFPRLTLPAIEMLASRGTSSNLKPKFLALRLSEFATSLRQTLYPHMSDDSVLRILRGIHASGAAHFSPYLPDRSWVLLSPEPFFGNFVGELLLLMDERTRSGSLPICEIADVEHYAQLFFDEPDIARICNFLMESQFFIEITAVPVSTRQFLLPGGLCGPRRPPLSPARRRMQGSAEDFAKVVKNERFTVGGYRADIKGPPMVAAIFSSVQAAVAARYGGAVVLESSELHTALLGVQVLIQWINTHEKGREAIDIIVAGRSLSFVSSEALELLSIVESALDRFANYKVTIHRIAENSIAEAASPTSRSLTVVESAAAHMLRPSTRNSSFDSADSHSTSTRSVTATNPFGSVITSNPFETSSRTPTRPKNPFAEDRSTFLSPKDTMRIQIMKKQGNQQFVQPAGPPTPPLDSDLTDEELGKVPKPTSVIFDDGFISEVRVMFAPTLTSSEYSFADSQFEFMLFNPEGIRIEEYDIDGLYNPSNDPASYLQPYKVARIAAVDDERIASNFSFSGGEIFFNIVGSVVRGISRVPWDEDVGQEILPYKEVMDMLKGTKGEATYPLFIRVSASPPKTSSTTSPSKATPKGTSTKRQLSLLSLKNQRIHQVIVGTNRKCSKIQGGDYIYGYELSEDSECEWSLASIAFPSSLGELGGDSMFLDTYDYTTVGLYSLTKAQAFSLIRGHPSNEMLVYVHGFNNSLTHACRSAGLFSRALQFPLTISLSWPSDPQQTGRGWLIEKVMSSFERSYTRCEHNMHASVRPFVQVSIELSRIGKELRWLAHSMGCYLLLNMIDRMQFEVERLADVFSRVILSAPDVPTWFFTATVSAATKKGVRVCHYFHPEDQAVEASRIRRAAEGPVPGCAAILATEGLQSVNCEGAKSVYIEAVPTSGANVSLNHDYGRSDGYCLLDQREFLADEPPSQRCLDWVGQQSLKGSLVPHWKLRTSK